MRPPATTGAHEPKFHIADVFLARLPARTASRAGQVDSLEDEPELGRLDRARRELAAGREAGTEATHARDVSSTWQIRCDPSTRCGRGRSAWRRRQRDGRSVDRGRARRAPSPSGCRRPCGRRPAGSRRTPGRWVAGSARLDALERSDQPAQHGRVDRLGDTQHTPRAQHHLDGLGALRSQLHEVKRRRDDVVASEAPPPIVEALRIDPLAHREGVQRQPTRLAQPARYEHQQRSSGDESGTSRASVVSTFADPRSRCPTGPAVRAAVYTPFVDGLRCTRRLTSLAALARPGAGERQASWADSSMETQ